ncbi:serine hydrolase [Methylobacterium sp. Leaf118]|uniref:serine hydrolase n=1 Tax=Methylobacterium sp. Leaf118 TaxID=2876562 RepID=UPI001E64E289|nr:serine hydrolase [Methylobacterium sp. Leaf118]
MTLRTRWLAFGVATLAALAGSGLRAEEALEGPQEGAKAGSSDDAAFDRFVEETRRRYGVPGAVVVVANARGAVTVKGYGLKEQGKPGRVDPDTRFQIASVSKFVTATAVGTLVERGVVSWDGPVQALSPETVLALPYATETATLRDYFAHRTGLPAYAGDLLPDLGLPSEDLVRRARFLAFDHSFRSQMAYSNYGIFLGQHAAATAAGTTPPDLIAKAILEPLAMTRSGPTQSWLFQDDNRASSHDRDGTVMAYENVDSFSGAGAVVSTGADFARWMGMVLASGQAGDRRLLAKDTLRQIFAPSMVEGPGGPLRDENAAAGLGCDSYGFLGQRIVEKNGALNGVRTIVTLIPELEIGIAIFANKQLTVFPEAVRAEFLERRIGRSGIDLQARIRAEQDAWNSIVDVPTPPADTRPAPHPLAAYAGIYDSPLYGRLRITNGEDGLAATIADRPALLSHWSADTFLLRFPNPDIAPGLLTFQLDSGRAVRIEGSRVPGGMSVSYGTFDRAPE